MPENKKLYFIMGIGRSGTTLLTKLLNKHPEIHCLPEANFLVFFLHAYKNKTNFTNKEIELIFKQIHLYSLAHPWVGWEFDIVAAKENVLTYITINTRTTYPELCKIIYENFKVIGNDKQKAQILIDKNPSFTLFMNAINKSIRDTKYVLMIRDYRANVLSRKQNAFLKSTNVAYNAIRWQLFNKKALRFQEKNSNKILFVRYEDLIKDSASELQKIYDFIGVTNLSSLQETNNHYNINNEKLASIKEHKKYFEKKYTDLSKPINTERLKAWEKELNEKEIKICDAICADFASSFGYHSFYQMNTLQKYSIRIFQTWYYIKALVEIYKEDIIFYFNPKIKLIRLHKIYKSFGFTE